MTARRARRPRGWLESERVLLRPVTHDDAEAVHRLFTENDHYFGRWNPSREETPTIEGERGLIEQEIEQFRLGTGETYLMIRKDDHAIVGRIALSQIFRRSFQNANVGYAVDEKAAGNGFATEALRLLLERAFRGLGLHRIQAGTMIANIASQRVLEKCGFRREGVAERYLLVNGVWEDHVIFALTREEWERARRRARRASPRA